MLMDSRCNVVRGWPDDGSRQRVETISAGASLQNGDIVEKQADGTVNKAGTTNTAKNRFVGVVVRGNTDSASAANSTSAVVLWGNYIAQFDSTCYVAGAFAPGVAVSAGGTGSVGLLNLAGATDPVMGFVLEVIAASTGVNGTTAHISVAAY